MTAKVKSLGGFIIILYVCILFFSLDAFGLKPYELGRYAGSLYGTLNLLSIGATICLLPFLSQNIKILKSPIGKAILLIGLLIAFYSVVEIVQGRTSKLINLMSLKPYLLFFTTLVVYEKVGIDKLWNILKVLSLICSLVAIIVVLFNIPDLSIQVKRSSEYNDSGVLIPTAPIIAFGMFAYLTSFLKKRRMADFVFAMICLSACFIQQHKGVLISMAFTLLVSYIINKKVSLKSLFRGLFIFLVAFFLLSIVLNKTGFSFNEIIEEFAELGSGGHSDDTALLRFIMLSNAYNYVISHFGMGIGLNWQEFDIVEYVQDAFALSPVMDSGYYDIIIMYGVYGIIAYLYCFISTLLVLYRERKRRDMGKQEQIYINSLLVLFIYILMSSITGEYFILDYSVMFYTTLALTLILCSRDNKPAFNNNN